MVETEADDAVDKMRNGSAMRLYGAVGTGEFCWEIATD